MKRKYIIIALSLLVVVILGASFVGYSENKFVNTIKFYTPQNLKTALKENIFFISSLRSKTNENKKDIKRIYSKIDNLEDQFKVEKNNINFLLSQIYDNQEKIVTPMIKNVQLITTEKNNTYKLKKFYYPSLPWQYNKKKPAGYLYQHKDLIFVASGDGVINYFNINDIEKESLELNIIKTNIIDLLNDENLTNSSKVSIRGIFIKNKKIFLSYAKKVKENCYNTSIMSADLDFQSLSFSEFFTYEECSKNFSNHTGGRMMNFNEESFLFTTGDGQIFSEVQNSNSMWGKLLMINFEGDHKIIAKGLRDTQGGEYYSKDKIVIMSEHGPTGGDEINAIRLDEFDKEVNFGWPIATYGEIKYITIPENKFTIKDELNHKKNGFKEPLAHYAPSVAPSHIMSVDNFRSDFNNDFFMSAMGNVPAPGRRALHHIKFDKDYKQVIFSDIIYVGERVRDMIYIKDKNKVILILENSPAISILEAL